MWATARLGKLLLWPIRRGGAGGAGGAVIGTADKDSRLEVKNQLNRDMLRTEDYFWKDTMWGQKTDAVGLGAAYKRITTAGKQTLDLDISVLNRSKYTFFNLTFNIFKTNHSSGVTHHLHRKPGWEEAAASRQLLLLTPTQTVCDSDGKLNTRNTPEVSGWSDRNSSKVPISDWWFIHRLKKEAQQLTRKMCCGMLSSNRLLTEYNHSCSWSSIIIINNSFESKAPPVQGGGDGPFKALPAHFYGLHWAVQARLLLQLKIRDRIRYFQFIRRRREDVPPPRLFLPPHRLFAEPVEF